MATLPLKSSHNEHCVVIVFFVDQKINANRIHCEMHLAYGDKCFTKRRVHIWCKEMLGGQKFVSYIEVQSVVLQWHGQQPASFFASGIQKFADR